MKKLLLTVALCLACLGANAQGPVNLSDQSTPLLSAPKKAVGTNVGFYFMFDSFLTPDYKAAVAAEALNSGGLGADVEFGLFGPFSIQAGGFASMYGVKQELNEVEPGDYWRLGAEAYLNWYVLPYLGAISNWLAPYIGIGYQYSSFKAQEVKMNTAAPMLQACIRLSLGLYYFDVAYRQSLPFEAFKPQRVIQFGGGFSF